MGKSGASALGVDWTCGRNARYLSGGRITLQGNFDPSRLLSPPSEIKKMVHQMINEFGKDRYISKSRSWYFAQHSGRKCQGFCGCCKGVQKLKILIRY